MLNNKKKTFLFHRKFKSLIYSSIKGNQDHQIWMQTLDPLVIKLAVRTLLEFKIINLNFNKTYNKMGIREQMSSNQNKI